MVEITTLLNLAEASGRKAIVLPKEQPASDVFTFPEEVEVKNPAKLRSELPKCELINPEEQDHPFCKTASTSFCKRSAAEWKQAFRDYILPYVQPHIYESCTPPGDDTIVIHLRNGDVGQKYPDSKNNAPFHQQPPCLYFHKVIEEGNGGKPFSTIQLIYEKEAHKGKTNMCIKDIVEKHNATKRILHTNFKIQSDLCMMLTAKNLAATSSPVSTTVKRMNPNLERYFWSTKIEENQPMANLYDLQFPAICEAYPKSIGFRIKDEVRPITKEDYFLNFPPKYLEELRCPGA